LEDSSDGGRCFVVRRAGELHAGEQAQWRKSGIRIAAAASIVAAGLAAGVGIQRKMVLGNVSPREGSSMDDLAALDGESRKNAINDQTIQIIQNSIKMIKNKLNFYYVNHNRLKIGD